MSPRGRAKEERRRKAAGMPGDEHADPWSSRAGRGFALPAPSRQAAGMPGDQHADPWSSRAGRGFALPAPETVGPWSAKAATSSHAIARLRANSDRDPMRPPDLGALGSKLAPSTSGASSGTAAVPFPGMTEEQVCAMYPGASAEQVKELLRLQLQNEQLLKQLQQRRRDMSRTRNNFIGETVLPAAVGGARTILQDGTYKVCFHDGSKPVHVDCSNKENVHIRACRGLTQPVQIYIEGIAELVYIEDCVNCTVIVECCLRGLAVHKGVNVDLFVAAEAPHISIQDTHGCELTFCPDSMDGGIETVRSHDVSLHCVFRKGLISLEPEDLLSASTLYTARVPVRIVTRHDNNHLVHECRENGHLPNSAELFWQRRARQIEQAMARGRDSNSTSGSAP